MFQKNQNFAGMPMQNLLLQGFEFQIAFANSKHPIANKIHSINGYTSHGLFKIKQQKTNDEI